MKFSTVYPLTVYISFAKLNLLAAWHAKNKNHNPKIRLLAKIFYFGFFIYCGVEQWQLTGSIPQRSRVRVSPPLPNFFFPCSKNRTMLPPSLFQAFWLFLTRGRENYITHLVPSLYWGLSPPFFPGLYHRDRGLGG